MKVHPIVEKKNQIVVSLPSDSCYGDLTFNKWKQLLDTIQSLFSVYRAPVTYETIIEKSCSSCGNKWETTMEDGIMICAWCGKEVE